MSNRELVPFVQLSNAFEILLPYEVAMQLLTRHYNLVKMAIGRRVDIRRLCIEGLVNVRPVMYKQQNSSMWLREESWPSMIQRDYYRPYQPFEPYKKTPSFDLVVNTDISRVCVSK